MPEVFVCACAAGSCNFTLWIVRHLLLFCSLL